MGIGFLRPITIFNLISSIFLLFHCKNLKKSDWPCIGFLRPLTIQTKKWVWNINKGVGIDKLVEESIFFPPFDFFHFFCGKINFFRQYQSTFCPLHENPDLLSFHCYLISPLKKSSLSLFHYLPKFSICILMTGNVLHIALSHWLLRATCFMSS